MDINKFLPILFGCHQKPERSFFFKGKQFPICARCTGILAGWLFGIVPAVIFGAFHWHLVALLLVPAIADGLVQHIAKRESNNIRRLVTGVMFGIANIQLVIYIHLGTVWLAKAFLQAINKQ